MHLEAVLFDACLMAGLETAYAISDYANWMIASEEVVAGKGTAVKDWLEQLYISPGMNGEWLGRWVCDMTQIRYTDEDDEQARQLLTWSVVDLSKIPRLVEMVDQGYINVGQMYAYFPVLMSTYSRYVLNVEQFGLSEGDEKMWDVAGVLYSPEMAMLTPTETLENMLNALKDAVVYNVRGPGRSEARGLSYCYAVNFDIKEMETYSRNCPMPHFLAFLDAISPWTAPDWVYEQAERLPEITDLPEYKIVVEKIRLEDGTPALTFVDDYDIGMGTVRYKAFRLDKKTGKIQELGIMPTYFYNSVGRKGAYSAVEPWYWPALEGVPVASYVMNLVEPGDINYLGSIPIQIDGERWFLRYGYFGEEDRYTVYGLWEGYDTDSSLFNRNVKSLSQMAGREYNVLYPVYVSDFEEASEFGKSEPQTMYRAMVLEDQPLPLGTYYFQYIVYDMFMRPMPMEWIEVEWDGTEMRISDETDWSGTVELQISEKYW